MANMIDYLTWRGDLPFDTVPLGEVDALILAQLAMMRWEKTYTDAAPLRVLADITGEERISEGFTGDNDRKLLAKVGESERFGPVVLSDYVDDIDFEAEKQFSAITLHLPEGVFVSYRGTDDTLVGWKEDCAMAFSRPVPAQEAAVRYLADIAAKYPGPLYVGGHSKGGNLAMFAATGVEAAVRERIRAVYNFDGPGLSDRMDAPGLYARMAGRLRSYVPQGSVVGLLLAHPDEFTVVKSVSVSVFQHDPYTWQVEGPRFVRMPGLSDESARFDGAFREWLQGISEEDRAALVDTLFGVLSATKSQYLGRAFWAGLAQNGKAVRETLANVPPETRTRIHRMITDLGRLALKPASKTEILRKNEDASSVENV